MNSVFEHHVPTPDSFGAWMTYLENKMHQVDPESCVEASGILEIYGKLYGICRMGKVGVQGHLEVSGIEEQVMWESGVEDSSFSPEFMTCISVVHSFYEFVSKNYGSDSEMPRSALFCLRWKVVEGVNRIELEGEKELFPRAQILVDSLPQKHILRVALSRWLEYFEIIAGGIKKNRFITEYHDQLNFLMDQYENSILPMLQNLPESEAERIRGYFFPLADFIYRLAARELQIGRAENKSSTGS